MRSIILVFELPIPKYNINHQNLEMQQSQPYPDAQQSSEGAYFNLQQNKSSQSAGLIQQGLAKQARSAFVIKVYLLLSLQLAVTFGMCMLSQYCEPFRNFQLDYVWVIVFPIILLMVSMGVAMAVPAARKFPLDMVVLLMFILSFSYMISFCCSQVVDQVQGPVVVIAIGTTVGIVIAITLYAIYCRANFVVLFGIIIVVAITMFMVAMVAIFTFEPVLISIYCGLAVIIYGIYLIFITKMIIGGEMGEGFPMDNYIIASLLLYVYIIKIFLMILRIVANSKGGR